MTQKDEGTFQLTDKKMQEYISGGRNAIEYSMLLVLIRPRALTEVDDAEMSELKALLKKYNEMMTKYEPPHVNTNTANDEHGAKE